LFRALGTEGESSLFSRALLIYRKPERNIKFEHRK
jgi:hypothetical protein